MLMLLMMIRAKNQCPSFLRYHLLALKFIQIPDKLIVRKVAERLHSRRFCLAVYQFQIENCTQDVVVYLHLVHFGFRK